MEKKSKIAPIMVLSIIIIAGIIFAFFLLKKKNSNENQNVQVSTNTENGSSIVNNTQTLENQQEQNITNNQQIENTNSVNAQKTENKNTVDNQVQENQNSENSASKPQNAKKVIVIDPGHQEKGNSEKEPIGPGASTTKAKVSTGATGVATKQRESVLNLKVAKLLEQELTEKGYQVIMTRTTNNVNLSNSERAKIANNANADAFIRIHGNSVDNSSVKGILTMCQTAKNKYNGNMADKSYKLSKAVLDNVIKTTGAVNKGVSRTDEMTGINWCTVPSTIIEMGFMSNPEEDRLLADESYQKKIVLGIVNGIEDYFGGRRLRRFGTEIKNFCSKITSQN